MSYLSKIFQSIPVKIPDRSGFDLSHEVLSTASCGTVVPLSHWEVNPGDSFSFGSSMKVTLPPFAVPFMGRIDAELTAAFIPYRLVWKGWQAFITQNDGSNGSTREGSAVGGSSLLVPTHVPLIEEGVVLSRQTLADYLGLQNNNGNASALPFLCYHKFCDDWIRDDNTMKPFFSKNPAPFNLNIESLESNYISHFLNSVSVTPYAGSSLILPLAPSDAPDLVDSSVDWSLGLGSLRQRCWAKDYFTTATYRPQAGAASSVVFDTSGATGSITIASLRAANSLQKWMERNNISGTEYGDQILAHFGVRPPDAVLNRSILLGSVRTPVYVGSVTNNSTSEASDSTVTSSPYGSILGSAAGFGSASDKGSLCDNFTAKEHGIIMVFFTLIPHAYYSTGVKKNLLHKTIGDFAFPEFANIGDQPIYTVELTNSQDDWDTIFGYNQRYSEYKFLPDRVSGYLGSNAELRAYALQRTFYGSGQSAPELGAAFQEIPKDFLNQVFAYWNPYNGVAENPSDVGSSGGFACMIDAYFDVKALRILPEYSLPHL